MKVRMRVVLSGAFVLMLATGLLSGCALMGRADVELLARARTADAVEERRAALVELKGRRKLWMRDGLERILRGEHDPACRALAADILGELANPVSVEQLRLSAQRDPEWVVRAGALAALGRILGKEVREDVEYALDNDSEPQVCAEALSVAYRTMSIGARDELTPILEKGLTHGPPLVRLRAARLLELITGRPVSPGYGGGGAEPGR